MVGRAPPHHNVSRGAGPRWVGLETLSGSCDRKLPPQGAQGRCEPQSSPWSLGTGITHRGLEASPGPSRPPPPQTQSEKGLGEGRGRQVPSEELCSIPSSSPDDSVRNIFCKSCRARYPTQVFLKRVQDGLFQTLSLGVFISLTGNLALLHVSQPSGGCLRVTGTCPASPQKGSFLMATEASVRKLQVRGSAELAELQASPPGVGSPAS